MSEQVDLQEFRAAYLAEADELLVAAKALLVEMEAALRAGRSAPREIRELLRVLHTVKGVSAMVGVDPIVLLAHRMEALLRAAERGGVVNEAALDALARGAREVEERVAAVAAEKPVPPPSPAVLQALGTELEADDSAQVVPEQELSIDPELSAKLAPDERARLVGVSGSQRAVRVDFLPSPARAAEGFSITTVRERVGALADIVRVLPVSDPATGSSPGGLRFVLLVVTSSRDAELLEAAGGPPAVVLELLRGSRSAEPPPVDVEPPPEPSRGILRVEVARIDDAIEKLAALIVTRSRMARAVSALSASGTEVRELEAIMEANSRQLRDLRGSMLRVRMVPVSELLDRLPLLVRDLRRKTGKTVHLVTDGGGAELDKSVAERLFPALVHLVRNAVDHGIEEAAQRQAAGKAAEGRLSVVCSAVSNRLLEVRVEDDGGGIDRAAVARRAASTSETVDDGQLLDMLCRPGFSTRDVPTTTSGRGVGMDIVRRIAAQQLGGALLLETTPGRGTTFIIRVPLTIAVVDAFTVLCGGERAAVPVPVVEEILELESMQTTVGGSLLQRRGEAVPVVDLAGALGLPRDRGGPARYALLVRRGGAPMAFGLERVLGQQEAVVRPLEDALVRVPGVSGTTDLGDGRPTLVLDLPTLAGLLAGEGRAA